MKQDLESKWVVPTVRALPGTVVKKQWFSHTSLDLFFSIKYDMA